jgi:hypothetical protein
MTSPMCSCAAPSSPDRRDTFRKVRSVHQNNVAAERLHFRDNLVTRTTLTV